MKKLVKKTNEITEEQAKHICFLLNERFEEMMSIGDSYNKKRGIIGLFGNGHSLVSVYNDGRVGVMWMDKSGVPFSPLIIAMLVTDYLREQGYVFKVKKIVKRKK
jgi:hypothetical protein